MRNQINAALIVLAAGNSSRMGSPKALLNWHGKPLLRHILDTAKAGGCSKFLVVLGQDSKRIQSEVELSDVSVLVNQQPESGQISSLKLGLNALDFSSDCVIVWPVDCPLIQSNDISALIAAYSERREDLKRVFIPTFNKQRGHPLLIDSCLRPKFLRLPENKTARDLIKSIAEYTTEVSVNNAGVLTDIDTPEQYNAALEMKK